MLAHIHEAVVVRIAERANPFEPNFAIVLGLILVEIVEHRPTDNPAAVIDSITTISSAAVNGTLSKTENPPVVSLAGSTSTRPSTRSH